MDLFAVIYRRSVPNVTEKQCSLFVRMLRKFSYYEAYSDHRVNFLLILTFMDGTRGLVVCRSKAVLSNST